MSTEENSGSEESKVKQVLSYTITFDFKDEAERNLISEKLLNLVQDHKLKARMEIA